MAVCEIWDVKGRLDHPIDYVKDEGKTKNPKYTVDDLQAFKDVIKYATNEEKTELEFFVSGVNCATRTARQEMILTKRQYGDEKEIVCFHGYQSFRAGEVTPELAHEIGIKLAEKMWGDRFQVVVATHLNTKCLHNHFVINSTSFVDGKRYYDNKANLRKFRQLSDELCREYSLSVIENPTGKKVQYALYKAKKQGLPTRDNVARQVVDEAIRKSFTLKDFHRLMNEMGYRCQFDPNRKYWTIIARGWDRPKRLYRLGEDYTNEKILERINQNSYAVKFETFSLAKKIPKKEAKIYQLGGILKSHKKIGGLRGLYLHYCYQLKILPKNKKPNYAKVHPLLKNDLMKMNVITDETRLLCRNRINTVEQLFSYKETLMAEMEQLLRQRKKLYKVSRSSKEDEQKGNIKSQLAEITKRLKIIRKEVRLCEGITTRNNHLKETLQIIRVEEQERREMMNNEYRRRRSRTNHTINSKRR